LLRLPVRSPQGGRATRTPAERRRSAMPRGRDGNPRPGEREMRHEDQIDLPDDARHEPRDEG
jgi:hypothetical protein